MNTKALEQAMMRAAIFELVIGLLVIGVLFWLTYVVIRAGVRDGINESNLRQMNTQKSQIPGYRWELVKIPEGAGNEDMRAER